jgi:hypothetical protein
VKREAGVPDREAGGSRWSLDHLFLDQEAVPTLVEVKRGDDTRIRREVVGQMHDYAANGVVYWPAERLRTDFEARCAKEGRDAAALAHRRTRVPLHTHGPVVGLLAVGVPHHRAVVLYVVNFRRPG